MAKIQLSPANFRFSMSPGEFIVNSATLKSEIESESPKPKTIHLVHNIYEKSPTLSEEDSRLKARESIRARLKIPNDKVIIAAAGRDAPEKDLDFFCDVFKKVSEKSPNTHGMLVGNCGERIKDRVDKLGIRDKVVFTGEVDDCRDVLPAADIFFLSSKTEGMPNIVLEAGESGCAVVSMDVGGVGEIFGNDSAGITVAEREPELVARKIISLIENPQLRRSLSENLRNRLQYFTPEAIICKYNSIIGT